MKQIASETAVHSADPPSRPGPLRHLLGRWRSEMKPGESLPPYENFALGNLGRLADRTALVNEHREGHLTLQRVGRSFMQWGAVAAGGTDLGALRRDRARSVEDVVERSRATGKPERVQTHRVVGGTIITDDLWAFPVSSRWDKMGFVLLLDEHENHHDLLETMVGATDEGMLALEAIRDLEGRPLDFQVIALNGGAARLLGLSQDRLLWHRLSDLSERFKDVGLIETIAQSVRSKRQAHFEATVAVDGAERHLRLGVAPTDELVSLTLTDIADIKAREEVLRSLFDDNPVPMWLLDKSSLRVLRVNDAAVQHYGYERKAFLRMTVLDLVPEPRRDETRTFFTSPTRARHAHDFWHHVRADGGVIEVVPYLREIEIERRPAILVSIVDVTERRRAEARVEHLAHHDSLTDLPNRSLFHVRLDAAAARARREGENLAVLCLDLDHFKQVNDTLGHPVGDKLLRSVAERFRATLRERDFVARVGGDEFAIIQAPIKGPVEAAELARRVIETIGRPYEIDGHQMVIGASIGIALGPAEARDTDILLKNADMALYRAKSDGRNTYRFFEPGMDAKLQARRLLEIDMRHTLAAGGFELHYQPLIDVSTQRITGCEALLRWRHAERGMVSPADFIPLAEEVGLIVPLGEWVLKEACTEAAAWPESIKIAVNLSPAQFKSPRLVEAVIDALAESGLPPSRLELEITESVLLHGNEQNVAVLRQLKDLGIRISMDDFGTGYSSLSYLQKFPFDKIKIDQSFVRDLSERPEAIAIIRAVTGLGRSLQMLTTAEGVETFEQFERLKGEGCNEAQGFLFSRPVPASELTVLLAARTMAPARTEADETPVV
ncbi:putative bifunctional diguanylate cyclase/phosphodiesterase [Consotaella aegiceratis]|uniref:putative bifunctional diguanylate cyclase/phosphodiesterase n=1 Tax=Consotaella aegiceratis TaxID=3097961 RepID=UPI002F3E2B50